MMVSEGHQVHLSCRVVDVSDAGYYEWRSRPPSTRTIRHAWLTEMITQVHAESNGTYGARRVHAELRLGRGLIVGHNAVELLMRRAGLHGLPGSRRPRRRHDTPTAEDLVDRKFARSAPDQLWVTDITEHPTREGKVYCAVVVDTFSRRVVGWSIDTATHRESRDERARHGDPEPPTDTRNADPQRSWHPVHVLGVHPTRTGIRTARFDGLDRGLLRQRGHRIVLGTRAGRAAEPAPVAHPP